MNKTLKTKDMDKKKIELIDKVAQRAMMYLNWDPVTVAMDLTYCIEGGCDLRLEDMLTAKPMDLLHDIYGINRNLDHETYKLNNCFLPRFARLKK